MAVRRYLLPALLACSATAMFSLQLAVATDTSAPTLDCQGDLIVTAEVYSVAGPSGADEAIDAATAAVDGPVIPGSSGTLEIEVVSEGTDSAVSTATDPDGNVTAIVALTGSDSDGWHLEHLETCP